MTVQRTSTSGGSGPGELVTVIIPARDEEVRLAACLDSVRNQTWPHLQVIVVDGASQDGTVGVALAAQRDDPRGLCRTSPAESFRCR